MRLSTKKSICWFICLILFVSIFGLGVAETTESEDQIIHINLETATDEELVEAATAILAEQKSRIVTKLILDPKEITVAKGKNTKITPTVTDMPEGAKISKTTWSTSDASIARVQNGTVTGAGGGEATITCTVLLSDGLELSETCKVKVIVAVMSLTAKPNNYTLGIGQSQKLTIDIKPKDASVKKLLYKSDDSNIVSVDSNGTMTANHGGKTTITISSTDGSEKSTKVTVYVPSISTQKTEYTVSQKTGLDIKLNYYGTRSNLSVSSNSKNATVAHSLNGNELTIHVTPNIAGNASITVADKSDQKSKVTLKVTIAHSAVYDKVSYPAINYDQAARYPSSYKGDKCSFSGRVLQVMDGWGSTVYRISSRGRWDNVVYVTIENSDITTPVIDNDNVTVYGVYDGNYTYTTVLGASITIPSVQAERIIVK